MRFLLILGMVGVLAGCAGDDRAWREGYAAGRADERAEMRRDVTYLLVRMGAPHDCCPADSFRYIRFHVDNRKP